MINRVNFSFKTYLWLCPKIIMLYVLQVTYKIYSVWKNWSKKFVDNTKATCRHKQGYFRPT